MLTTLSLIDLIADTAHCGAVNRVMSRLLLVSSRAPFCTAVHQVVTQSVCVVHYDYDRATLQDITDMVIQRLGDTSVTSLAMLLHCDSSRMFICFNGHKMLTAETVQNDSSVQEFLKQLTMRLAVTNDGVHLFNSAQNLDPQALTRQMTLLLNCSVELVKDLFGPVSQQSITELYFHIPLLKNLLQSTGSKVTSLDGYEKIRTVGKGAFGTAVLYRKMVSNNLVVIKEINMMELAATERQMALNEVQVLSSLHHSNIIRYLGSFEVDGVLMIEMEYADGGTLAQLISRSSRLNERDVLTMFQQCVGAIQYMHQNNILHRDLKTANVFLTKDKLIKVGDFGISKVMSTKSQAQTVLGTPYYISPEMCEGKQYDHKSDVWALGCILYEIACLHKTFQGNNLPALVNKIMKGTFEPVPLVYSKGLRELVIDLLQKDPTLRPTAAETHSRVSTLLKQAEKSTSNSMPCKEVRSVLYQISGRGSTFSCIPVLLPPTMKITQVATSNTHYIAVSADMTVFTWGEGKRGQLGHPQSITWLQQPTAVQALADKSISAVGAGDGFSMFLTDSGVLMTCGDGTFGCLGHRDWNSVSKPQLVERLLNMEVRQIACGEHHCVALTCDNELFTWGRGESGRLGIGHEQDTCEPTQVTLGSNRVIKNVYCGPDCTAVITETGAVYTCGRNTYNKLGLTHTFLQRCLLKSTSTEKCLILQEVRSLSSWQIMNISMAANHSAALTECGRVITMGSNTEAQTGHHKTAPCVMAAIQDKIALDVACGPTYTVMTSTHNVLYFWGTRYHKPSSVGTNSTATLSLLQTEIVVRPEEILALYSSPTQIARGEIVTVSSVNLLWDTILVLVNTTVPLAVTETNQVAQQINSQVEYDSLGPIPEWIAAELAQAEDQWEEQLSTI